VSQSITNNSIGLNGKREQIICLASGLLVFLISLIISRLYTGGDQHSYSNAYVVVSGLGLGNQWHEIQMIYQSWISSSEFVHLLVLLVGGGLDIDKNLLMSLVNGILAAYAVRLFLSWGASVWVATGLVVTNYYFYVLYFAAERLKFAALFLVLALLCSRKPLRLAASTLISIFSHFSVLFIYCGIWLSRLPEKLSKRDRMDNWILVSPLAVLVLVFWGGWDYLLWKLNQYLQMSGFHGVYEFLPVTILLMFSCLYAKRSWEPLLAFLPILVGVALLGGSRLNMLGFFIFLYFGIQVKAGLNAGVIGLMCYLLYKTVMFVESISTHGQGFVVTG
jgi:hypothetical protein